MVTGILSQALSSALAASGIEAPAEIHLERPGRREHGDWSSNVAMATAKKAGKNPRELAGELVAHIEANMAPVVKSVEIAGPGFVNFHLHDTWLYDVLTAAVEAGTENFGRSDFGAGEAVNVEFVSANPNKPLHAGHARGACYGDTLARMLDRIGFTVTRETLLNDRGVQMQLFAESLAARKRGEEPPEDGYQGEYLVEWASEMPDDADPAVWGYERAIESHRQTLEKVGIVFDVWFSEKSMVATGVIDVALGELAERGMTYTNDDALWLKSTDFGDDKDRVLVKSDGDYTYLAPDIAYHRDKFSRAPKLINIWGADHHGYIQRMKAAMSALGQNADNLEIKITQMVDLERDGKEFRMSGRAGEMVTFDDVIAEVGADAARFTYLMQSVDSRQTVDLDLIASQAMDNPVFYVQYAHARICSLVAKAAEAGHPRKPLAEVDLSLLSHERELDVLRALATLPETIERATAERAAHTITNWTREFAAAFHSFYHDCYVVGDGVSAELTQARLWLVEASRVGLVVGLDLLGVSAPEKM